MLRPTSSDLEYTADGFELMGRYVKLKAYAPPLGPLGTAFNKAAFRTDTPSQRDGSRCYRMHTVLHLGRWISAMGRRNGYGESFDMWIHPKCKNGYSRFFVDSTHASSDGRACGKQIPDGSNKFHRPKQRQLGRPVLLHGLS